MDDAVERLTERLKRESPEEALAETMAGDLRLNGDVLSYEDPANADLISVLERRLEQREVVVVDLAQLGQGGFSLLAGHPCRQLSPSSRQASAI